MTPSKVHTSTNVEANNIIEGYKSNDSFDKLECCIDIVAVFGNNVAKVAGFGNNVERNFGFFDKVKTN